MFTRLLRYLLSVQLLEEYVGTLCTYLTSPMLAATVLTTFVDLALASPASLVTHREAITSAVKQQPVLICQAAQILGTVGTIDEVSD